MALSQQQSYTNMPLPASSSRSGSNEGSLGYPAHQQNAPGSYGHYGFAGQQQTGYGAQNDPGWIQRVLEEMKDMLVLLNAEGRIKYMSPSAKQITGRAAKQFEGTFLTQYIHDDDKHIFLRDMSESVVSEQPLRTHVRFQKSNNTYGLIEIHGHPHIANLNVTQGRNGSSQERCTGFFLTCRPYPTKNSELLDSFLEHKIENARLVQQIAKLKQEEVEEANMTRVSYGKPEAGSRPLNENPPTSNQVILSDQESTETVAPNSDSSDENPHEFFTDDSSRAAQHLSHIDGIEVMTGLYYGDGERSQGLSTGLNKGRLVHCDIDITTAADQARNVQEGDRRKRLKGQHVCGDCGTADSPEWRKGPGGPKTLCNACGLRWSKKEKKRQEST